MTMSDRIAVMHRGKLEQLGAPEDLYERPATDFVARFLGVSNLLEAEVADRDGPFAAMRLKDGTIVRAPSEMVNGAGRLRVGVRPEKLRILAADEATQTSADLNVIEGTVLDASYIGVSTQYLVATPYDHRVVVYAQNLETSGASEVLADGQRVRLSWKPQHTFVISDAATAATDTDAEEEPSTDA